MPSSKQDWSNCYDFRNRLNNSTSGSDVVGMLENTFRKHFTEPIPAHDYGMLNEVNFFPKFDEGKWWKQMGRIRVFLEF